MKGPRRDWPRPELGPTPPPYPPPEEVVLARRRGEAPEQEQETLTESTKEFHQSLIEKVPVEAVQDGRWKHEVFKYVDVGDEMLDSILRHLEDIKSSRNKRIYIGPGRDGSSDDKIAVDCKIDPRNTSIPYNKEWARKDYVKSTYAHIEKMPDYGEGDDWKLIEDGEPVSYTHLTLPTNREV